MSLQRDQVKHARDYYRQSLAIRERLAAADPHCAQVQHYLVVSYYKVGLAEREAGEYARSLKAFREGVSVLDRMIERGQNVDVSR